MIPWLWSFPTALMTAELSSAMPEDGGYVVWVERAFGRFWGFQEGWLSWLCSFADNALAGKATRERLLNPSLIAAAAAKGGVVALETIGQARRNKCTCKRIATSSRLQPSWKPSSHRVVRSTIVPQNFSLLFVANRKL